MEPYRLTATQALKLIRQNQLRVEDYARSLLSRIDQRNPTIKAWVYLNRDSILQQARELDHTPLAERGPLHGVPIAVKDAIYTKDMPTQHNSPLYKNSHPEIDAASVAILRAAGALIFGKTTTTEFTSMMQGPETRNPHDTSRTPGGSSSGSAAAVADYQIPLALGTQTGGSTIRPGSFNGIYAFKPTWGSVSREGQKVYSPILDTIGWFGRCVEDLGLLADVFGLEDDEPLAQDEEDRTERVETSEKWFRLEGARFGVVRSSVWSHAGEGTIAALESAVRLLRSHGAVVEEVELSRQFDQMPEWCRAVMASDARVTFLPEYRMDKTKLQGELVGEVENVKGYSRQQQLRAVDGMAALRPVMDEIAGRYAALLTPSVPDEAPVGIQSTGSAVFNSMWTALHTPVVNIPGFQGANGLPIGVSLVAPRYRDQHLIRVAKEVGRVFEAEGGWKPGLVDL